MMKCLRLALVFLFLSFVAACGGGGGGSNVPAPVETHTIQWQPDGNGAMQFLTNDPAWYGYGFWYGIGATEEAQMTSMAANVEKKSGSANTGYGVIFCYQDSSNFYRVYITVGGYYSVSARVAGTYTQLIPWTSPQHATIYTGFGVPNAISVTQVSPNNFAIGFNGVQEIVLTDSSFTGGKSGFAVSVSPTYESFPAVPEDVRCKLVAPVQFPSGAGSAAALHGVALPAVEGYDRDAAEAP